LLTLAAYSLAPKGPVLILGTLQARRRPAEQ
jgi:hypothetical protein